MPRRTLNGNGLAEWPTRGRDQPIVVRANAEAARVLGLTLDQLAQAVEDLEAWGLHADGSPVYRCRELLVVLGRAPAAEETPSQRGSRNANAARREARKAAEAR